jgi:hypothetical protein
MQEFKLLLLPGRYAVALKNFTNERALSVMREGAVAAIPWCRG